MAKQQQNPIIPVQWFPQKGGLNSDSDLHNISGGDLTVSTANSGAMNVRAIGKGTNVSPSYEPFYGNTLSYTIDTAVVSDKAFRILVDITNEPTASDYTVTLSTPSGAVLSTFTTTLTISDIATALSDLDTEITTNFSAFTPVTSTTQTGTYTGYVDVTFTVQPYFNFLLAITVDTGDVTLTVKVTQEAVDPSMTGDWHLIGSDDRSGDDFQFFTTRARQQREVEILTITNPSGTVVQVETLNLHGLIENQSVRIQGVVGTVEANGDWIAINVTPYTFDLALCEHQSTYVSGGIVIADFIGYGEIGVAVEDDNGAVIYTRLLRSREFNFSVYHQIDARAKRKQDSRIALYFTESRGNETIDTDTTNVPRVFYYQGAYVTDGALQSVDPQNIYEYGTISSEIRWVLSNSDFSLRWVEQIQKGGDVKSGMWSYAARLVTEDFTKTNWSQLTEGVPVFSHDYTANPLVIGDSSNTKTPKINVLELTNNAIGLFKYVEVAAINYIGANGFNAVILGQTELNNQTVQIINHTGNENNVIDLDAGGLNQINPGFLKAQNVELLEGRAILSNLTPIQTADFTEFVKTFQYRLDREILEPIGVWNTGNLSSAEYQIPSNVYSKKSHMMMETYRYGFQFRLKNGGITQVFYPGYDIKIDLPIPSLMPKERIAGSFTSFDLTDNAVPPTEVYSIVINWLNINLFTLIGGTTVYELVDEIIPCRATVIPEVLGRGVVIMGVNGRWGDANANPRNGNFGAYAPPHDTIGPYPFICGQDNLSSDIYPGTFAGGGGPTDDLNAIDTSAFFYCPDISWNLLTINHRAGDKIISLGAPSRHNNEQISVPNTTYDSYYAEFNGNSGVVTNAPQTTIDDAAMMEFPDSSALTDVTYIAPNTIISAAQYNMALNTYIPSSPGINFPYYHDRAIACSVPSSITNTSGNPDYGFYMAIYYRELTDKYDDPSTTVYTEFLLPYKLDLANPIVGAGDFTTQGDVFTQKTYLKYRYPGWWAREFNNFNDGYGAGFAYYTQNRNNIQLRRKPTEVYSSSAVIQQLNYQAWLVFGFALSGSSGFNANGLNYFPEGAGRDSQLFYNQGYTPKNLIVSARAFNANDDFQKDWGNAIAWSNIDSDGSNTDGNRVFPPFNIKFLDYTQGAITNALELNGELVTIQRGEVQRQYFDTTSIFSTQDGTEVVLGSGAVLSRKGTTMNKFGSRHKWSTIIGLSDRGHDALYAIDDTHNVAWRLGYDGTTAIEEIQNMKSFFSNNLQWIRGKYTPAQDEGIRGVANNRYKEIMWTIRGRKNVPEWTDSETTVSLIDFQTMLGVELITNPNFNGSLYGWENLGGSPFIWQYWASPPPTGAYRTTAFGVGEYLIQSFGVAFVVGRPYQIKIVVTSSTVSPIQIRFQIPGTLIYTLPLGAGTYFFTYIAQVGDDNISIFGPGLSSARIQEVSIREIITATNWLGNPTWLIGNNQACADGSDGDELVQGVPDYLVVGDAYIVDYTLEGITTGDVQLAIADQLSAPESADGVYSFAGTPTVTGVLRFIPDNGFDGCVKGNLRLTRIATVNYTVGDVVQVPSSNFNQLPDLYVCLVSHSGGSLPTPLNPLWQLIPRTDADYFNEYTIVFSELKNVFQTFVTFLPKIYAKFLNRYLVPRPISNTGRMYLSDSGLPTTWFSQDASVQTGDAYFDATINVPTGRKRYLAVRVRSDIAPYTMRVTTSAGFAITNNSDFVQREGNEFDGPVKNNAIVAGVSDADTSIMQGDWAIMRFTILATTYNKINMIIAKVRERARKWQQ